MRRIGSQALHAPALWVCLALIAGVIPLAHIPFHDPDCRRLIDIGRAIAAGEGIGSHYLDLHSTSNPEPRVPWAPGYPMLLAGLMRAGIPDLAAVQVAQIAAVLVAILCLYLLASRLASPRAGIVALVLWILWAPFSPVYRDGYSDGPFIALMLLTLLVAGAALRRRGPRLDLLIIAGLLAGIAMFTRNVGAALGVGIAVAVLLSWGGRWRGRIGAAGLFALAFAVPVLPMVWRNWALTGNLTVTYYIFGGVGVADNIKLFPKALLLELRAPLLVLAAGLLLGGAGAARLRAVWRTTMERGAGGLLSAILLTAVCYAVVIIAFTGTTTSEGLSARYFAPLGPLLIVLVSALLDRLAPSATEPAPDLGLAVAFVLALSAIYLLQGQEKVAVSRALAEARAPARAAVVGWVRAYTLPDDVIYPPPDMDLRWLTGRQELHANLRLAGDLPTGSPVPLPQRMRAFLDAHAAALRGCYYFQPLAWTDDLGGRQAAMRSNFASAGLEAVIVKRFDQPDRRLVVWRIARSGRGPSTITR